MMSDSDWSVICKREDLWRRFGADAIAFLLFLTLSVSGCDAPLDSAVENQPATLEETGMIQDDVAEALQSLAARRLVSGKLDDATRAGTHETLQGWRITRSVVCRQCHEAYAGEYSMSPMSSSATNGLFLKVLESYTVAFDGKLNIECVRCHSATGGLRYGVQIETALDREGINCSTCHSIKSLKIPVGSRPIGINSYELSDGTTFYSAIPARAPTQFHRVEVNPLFRKSEFCFGCHGTGYNAQGVMICKTWDEYEKYIEKTGSTLTCQDCHLRHRRRPASTLSLEEQPGHGHDMAGSSIEAALRHAGGLSVTTEMQSDGRRLICVAVANRTGHGLPTGIPERFMVLKVRALAQDGTVVWENYPGDDYLQAKQGMFNVQYHDNRGVRGVPGRFAYGVVYDHRMLPAEVRILRYSIPQKAALRTAKVQAWLDFYMFRAYRLKEFGIVNPYWTSPHRVSEITVNIDKEYAHANMLQ